MHDIGVLLLRLLVPACPAANHLQKRRLARRLAVLVVVRLQAVQGGTQGRSRKAPVRTQPRLLALCAHHPIPTTLVVGQDNRPISPDAPPHQLLPISASSVPEYTSCAEYKDFPCGGYLYSESSFILNICKSPLSCCARVPRTARAWRQYYTRAYVLPIIVRVPLERTGVLLVVVV